MDVIKAEKNIKEQLEAMEIPFSKSPFTAQEIKIAEEIIEKYHTCIQQETLLCIQQETAEADIDAKIKLKNKHADIKIELFYELFIKKEATTTKQIFQNQLSTAKKTNDCNLLRKDSVNERASKVFNGLNDILKKDKIASIFTEAKNVNKRDDSGFLWGKNLSVVKEKTEDLERLYRKAVCEYQKLYTINEDIGFLLEYVRLRAARNIYLGIEILNYIRDNAGGKSLRIEKDIIDNIDVKKNIAVEFDKLEFNMADAMHVLGDAGIGTLKLFGDKNVTSLLQNKNIMKTIVNNPKTTGGVAGAAAGIMLLASYFDKRNEKMENNLEIQKKIIKEMKDIEKNYTKNKGCLLRAIEVIKAISKANSGFMHVYEPLKNKVFVESAFFDISMKEIQELVMATQEYNKINTSRL